MAQMTWYIRGSNELGALHDQFIEGPFRLMFRGTSLVIRIEGVPVNDLLCEQASILARRYVENLGRLLADTLSLLTEKEYMALPVWAHQNHAMLGMQPPAWAPDGVRVIREARNSVISYKWPLRACYDYLQDASTDLENFFPEIYKMVETMAHHVGGEAALIEKTGLRKEVKLLKRIANEHDRDERHAPKDSAPPVAPTGAELAEAQEYASTLLRKFEELCRADGVAGGACA